jgi:anti-anti-sigma factor
VAYRRNLEVRTERIESSVVVFLHGRLTVEAGPCCLQGLARWMARIGGRFMVVDLGNVAQLDCSGIGQLVQLRNAVCQSGGAFALVNVECRQKRLMQLVGLFTVLHVFGGLEGALSWFREATAQRHVILIQTARSFTRLERLMDARCPPTSASSLDATG